MKRKPTGPKPSNPFGAYQKFTEDAGLTDHEARTILSYEWHRREHPELSDETVAEAFGVTSKWIRMRCEAALVKLDRLRIFDYNVDLLVQPESPHLIWPDERDEGEDPGPIRSWSPESAVERYLYPLKWVAMKELVEQFDPNEVTRAIDRLYKLDAIGRNDRNGQMGYLILPGRPQPS